MTDIEVNRLEQQRGIEHLELRGLTVKNLIVTIGCTISICTTVILAYTGMKSDMQGLKDTQETTNRVNELRIKNLENTVQFQQSEIDALKTGAK